MENNSDRMGFALIAISVVAFVLLAVNGPLKSTVNGFFNGFNTWQTQTVNGISETTKPDVTHTAYSWSSDGTDRFTTVYPNLNLFTGTSDKPSTKTGNNWNIAIIGTYKTPKVGQKYTVSVEVPNADHDVWMEVFCWNNAGARVGNLAYTLIKSGEKAHVTFTWPDPGNSGATQFAANLALTNGTDTGTYSYCKAKLEIGNTATPYMPSASELKPSDQPKYIGTYTDKNESASQKSSDYTWTLNPDYHE